jgi:hypothetical protein
LTKKKNNSAMILTIVDERINHIQNDWDTSRPRVRFVLVQALFCYKIII